MLKSELRQLKLYSERLRAEIPRLLFRGSRQPAHEDDTLSSAEVKNKWSYTSTSNRPVLGHKNKFTFVTLRNSDQLNRSIQYGSLTWLYQLLVAYSFECDINKL